MDRPAVDRVDGVPPAIAIDQTNPVRSSRSTVGTMTELNDHLKLLYARAAQLFDRETAQPVRHDTPETIYAELLARTAAFAAGLPPATAHPRGGRAASWGSIPMIPETRRHLPGRAAGQHQRRADRAVARRERLHARTGRARSRVADRAAQAARRRGGPLPHPGTEKARAIEAIETALRRGSGRVNVYVVPGDEGAEPQLWRFSTGLHCPESDLALRRPAAGAVLVQFGRRRVRHLPRLRPRDWRRLGPRDPRREEDASQWRDQDDPDAGVEGRSRKICGSTPARPASRATRRSQLSQAQRDCGDRGRPLAEEGATGTSSGTASGATSSATWRARPQDAHPRALVEVPQLHDLPGLVAARGSSPRPCCGAWARRRTRGRRDGAGNACYRPECAGRALSLVLPGLEPARPDEVADRSPAPLLRGSEPAEHVVRRSAQAAARRDPERA